MMKRLSKSVPERTSGASIARSSGPDTAGAGAGASRAVASGPLATVSGPLATTCQPRSVGRADLAAALALLLLAGIALGPLCRSGIPAADDLLASIYRVFALHEGWKAGNFYPALSADLSFGYLAPLFLYYPPLAKDLAPGACQLVTGRYDPQTMLNLPISGSSQVLPTNRLSLAPVEILPGSAN
jgi:hypothetical protein